jgi:hypothetical protein
VEKTRKEKRRELLERAESKIKSINNDYVFKADFECGRILKEMILEIMLLEYQSTKYRKILEHHKLYIKKLEKKIEAKK